MICDTSLDLEELDLMLVSHTCQSRTELQVVPGWSIEAAKVARVIIHFTYAFQSFFQSLLSSSTLFLFFLQSLFFDDVLGLSDHVLNRNKRFNICFFWQRYY